tara:strand:+ start:1806 stop:2441 length:636 start_codon:yes stop_codon:yes gene_type:complete
MWKIGSLALSVCLSYGSAFPQGSEDALGSVLSQSTEDFYEARSIPNVENISSGILIDFDNDGDLDFAGEVFADRQQATPVLFYRNDGLENFEEATGEVLEGPEVLIFGGNNLNTWEVADFNGDGLDDLFFGDIGVDDPPFNGASNMILIQTDRGTLSHETADRLPTNPTFSHDCTVGDFDLDGDIFDLDTNGEVGFSDFQRFAGEFGTTSG